MSSGGTSPSLHAVGLYHETSTLKGLHACGLMGIAYTTVSKIFHAQFQCLNAAHMQDHVPVRPVTKCRDRTSTDLKYCLYVMLQASITVSW